MKSFPEHWLPPATPTLTACAALPLIVLIALVFLFAAAQPNTVPARISTVAANQRHTPAAANFIEKVFDEPPPLPTGVPKVFHENGSALPLESERAVPAGVQPAAVPLVAHQSADTARGGSSDHRKTSSEVVIESLDKAAYSIVTDLKAVIESQSWEDAASLIASLDAHSAAGVTPYLNDQALRTSLPVAIALAREDYPELRQALAEKLADLGRVRLASAIRDGDAAQIEFAAIQFAESPAAADAHRWLGDQALVSGRFDTALTEYERARGDAATEDDNTQSRIRLAAAMVGRTAGEPPTLPVKFGELAMQPNEFESLVAQARSAAASSTATSLNTVAAKVLPFATYRSRVLDRFPPSDTVRAGQNARKNTVHADVTQTDQRLIAFIDRDILYVVNPLQVAAYDLTVKQYLWENNSETTPSSAASQQHFAPARPLQLGNRLFLRRPASSDSLLVCLDTHSGKLHWTSESRPGEQLVSDPLFVDGQLVAFSVADTAEDGLQLRYCFFDPKKGAIDAERKIVTLHADWQARSCCQLTASEGRVFVVLGGAVLSLDSGGAVRWIRTEQTSPATTKSQAPRQLYQPPLIKNGRMFVTQPGVNTVECLAAATGRRFWHVEFPGILGVVGLADDLLVVLTEHGLRGLDAISGQARWEMTSEDLYDFHLLDDHRLLVAAREPEPQQPAQWRPVLIWVNSADGKVIGRMPIPDLSGQNPTLGPLLAYQNRLITFFNGSPSDPARQIVEIRPEGPFTNP